MFFRISVSTDDPMLAGWLRGVRTLQAIPVFWSLGSSSKVASTIFTLQPQQRGKVKEGKGRKVDEKFFLFYIHELEITYITSIYITWAEHSHTVIAQGKQKMCPTKIPVTLERHNVSRDQRGGTPVAFVIEACKAHSIRLVEGFAQKEND